MMDVFVCSVAWWRDVVVGAVVDVGKVRMSSRLLVVASAALATYFDLT